MRVTNKMISDRVVFNLQRSLSRFATQQTATSTGRRINRPSDDPIGTVRDLNYRAELGRVAQLRENISQGQSWTSDYDNILDELKNGISTAKELAIAMANDTYDDVAREGAALEVASLFQRMIEMGNSELDGRSVFGGTMTRSKPFAKANNGVVYLGDDGIMEFDIEPGSRTAINLIGRDVFLKEVNRLGQNADLNIAISGNTLLTDLRGGQGISAPAGPGTIVITDGNRSLTASIDLSAATSINDVITTINAGLAASSMDNVRAVVGPDGNNIMFDVDETHPQSAFVSITTKLINLNQGAGIPAQPTTLRVTNGTTVNETIDLNGAVTLLDVINRFNAVMQGAHNIYMNFNATATGLEIVDANGVPLDVRIADADGGTRLSSALGIEGTVNAQLVGRALNPRLEFQVADSGSPTAAELGIAATFSADYRGADLNPVLTANSPLSAMRNGASIDRKSIVIWQGAERRTLNLGDTALVTIQDLLDLFNNSGLAITASINQASTGIQIVNDNPSTSLTIEDLDGRTAKDLQIFGGADIMGMFIVLNNALRENDQEGVGLLLEGLDNGIQHSLNARSTVGARALRLQSADTRMSATALTFTELLAKTEDLDLTDALSDLAMLETNYQTALAASAKIIQPSLLNFLEI